MSDIILSYKLDEGSGTVANPHAGSAVLTGVSPIWSDDTPPSSGDAYISNPVGNPNAVMYANTSLPTDMHLWDGITFMCWYRPSASEENGLPFALMTSSESAFMHSDVSTSDGYVRAWCGSAYIPWVGGNLWANTWSHFALSWNKTVFRMIINGIEVGNVPADSVSIPSTFHSLSLAGANYNPLSGDIGGPRLLNSGLNATQVLALMQIPVRDDEGPPPPPTPLQTPLVTVTEENDPSEPFATDGSIRGTYTTVPNGDRYEIAYANGHGMATGFIPVDPDGPSPFLITNRPAGQYTVGVRAHPAE